MKIRTQFILTLSFFALILIGMVTSLSLTNRQVDRLLRQAEIARRIEQGASELNYLSGDYLMYGESRQRARWESRFASFSEEISKLDPANLQQETIVAHIKADQARLEAVFSDIVATLEGSSQTSGTTPDPAFTQVSWSRMEVQNQSIAFESSLLARQLQAEADRLRQLNIMLIFVLIGIFGAYLLTNYYLIDRRALRAIAQLQAGTKIIGSGNLDFTIAAERPDEIGELSQAFNRMTANLKEVTASKTDLEREIEEREQVEEALRRTNERLQEQARELDARAEELRAQTEELAKANKQLSESQHQYATIFDTSPFAMSLSKMPENILVGVNNAFLKLFEFTWQDVIGKTSVDLGIADPGSRAKIAAEMRAHGSVQNFEVTRLTKTGTRSILSLNLNAVTINGGEHILTTVRDVTERRRAEEALRQGNERLQAQAEEMEMQTEELRLSEEVASQRFMEIQKANTELQSARLAALNLMEDSLNAQEKVKQINIWLLESEQRLNRAQEMAHLGSWELDLVNNRLTWSDEVYRIFGLQPQEFRATYEAFLEAVHPDDRSAVDEAYSGSIRDGRDTYEIEHRVVRRSSGEIRIVHEKCEHFRDEAGQIISSVGMVHDITDRKKAEEYLQRFQLLSEHSRDIILFIRRDDGSILGANAAAADAYGYSRDELLLQSIQNLRAPNTRGLTSEQMEQADAIGILFETVHQRKDGSCFPAEVSSKGATIGGVRTLVSVVRDITERKKAEEALRTSEEKYRNLFENMTEEVHFWHIERDESGCIKTWRLVDANPPTLRTWGRTSIDDIRGKTTDEIFGPGATEHYLPVVQKIIAENAPHSYEDYFPNLDKYFRFTSVPFGEYFITTGADITSIKKAEQALQQSEAMLRTVLDQMPSGVTVRDASTGEIILANARSREIMGGLVNRVDQLAEYHGLHADGRPYRSEEWPVSRSIATGERVDGEEIEFLESNGARKVISISSAPVRDAQGKIISGIAVFHDITERKRTEERLRQFNRTLRALSNTNQVMMRARSEGQYLQDVCNIVVEDCGHSMVWIGYARDDEVKSVLPVASAGFEAGYLETLNISWADGERGRGPTGTAIRTGKTSRCNNMLTDPQFALWREEAIKRGYASSLVLPLLADGKAFGALNIYSHEPDAFSADEEALLTELVGDLAYGIQAIRLREAHDRAEAQLRRARDELEIRVHERTEELAAANRELSEEIAERKEIERQLRIQTAAMDSAANGIIITDPKGIILWANPAITQISGYEESDLVGQSTHIFSSGRHGADFYQQMWETILAGNVWHGETTNRRKDGGLYVEEQTITPVQNEDGKLSHFIAIKQDVTERNLIYSQLEDSNRDLRNLTASERQQRFLAEGLVESSVALNMSLEVHAVLDLIFEQTRRTIPYLMADVVLIKDGIANVVQQWGENRTEPGTNSEDESLRLEDFPVWRKIFGTKSAVMILDTDLDDQWNPYLGMAWVRSYLGAPLIYEDQVIGIINLGSDRANAFHPDMVKTLAAFAAPAAVAIQNARLYEDEQQNRKIAEVLSAASVALSQTLDIETVIETVLDYMQFIMPLDVAFVLLSEGDERYRVRAVRAEREDRGQYDTLRDRTIDTLSEPIVGAYFAKSESTFIPDTRQIAEWSPPLELASMSCWLGIPLESMGKALGMVVIANALPRSFTGYQVGLAEAVVKQAVVALQNAWLFEQVRSGRERLQQLSRHLVEVQENERKYIARELHDETSQSLTSLKMGLQVIEQNAAGHAQVLEQVKNLKRLADETLESLHHIAVNLRPASLDHLGLVDALTGLIELTRQRSGLNAHFKTMGLVPATALTEEIEASVYRIVQESLTNVVRHAHASYADVILEWQDDRLVIIIEDDGVGLDLQKARETGHLGLVGMQERAEMLGGKLVVDSTPQSGTTLVVEIPYANTNTYSR